MTPSEVKPYASEGGHWYRPDGTPCYEIQAKSGAMRPTTLRDARKLGLYPSVTGIIKCAAAPGLEMWKQKQVLLAALTIPRIDGEPDDAFIARILADSKEEARVAAELGEQVHASIERAYRGEPHDHPEAVDAFRLALQEKFGPLAMGFNAEKSFGCPLGYGGKVDIHHAELVVDIKTKDEVADDMELYDEHVCQLAAYRHGLGLGSETRCAIAFIRRTAPWKVVIREADPAELRRGWLMFASLLSYWQAKTGHRPERP